MDSATLVNFAERAFNSKNQLSSHCTRLLPSLSMYIIELDAFKSKE